MSKKENLNDFLESESGNDSVTEIKHNNIGAILKFLLWIIVGWGVLLILACFLSEPKMSEFQALGYDAYLKAMELHKDNFRTIAQLTLVPIIPVFSTLAGSYIKGGD